MGTPVLDYTKVLASAPADCGDNGMRLTDALGNSLEVTTFPTLQEGRVVWTYTVPAGKTLSLKSLVQTQSHGAMTDRLQLGTGTFYAAGVLKMQVDAVDKLECRVHAPNIWGDTPAGGYNELGFNQLIECRGVVFTNANTIRLAISPDTGGNAAGICYFVQLHGKLGTTPDIRSFFYFPEDTTADQTIGTYNPASNWTLLGLTVSAFALGTPIMTGLRMEINGAQVLEIGKTVQSHLATAPAPLWFNFWNMQLSAGDTIRLVGPFVLNARHTIATQLAGTLNPLAIPPTIGRGGVIVKAA